MNHYDNLDRVVKAERYYDADADGPGSSADAPDQNDTLLARSETFYDDRGRVYRTKTYAVDPATGTPGNCLTSNTWYDAAGRPSSTRRPARGPSPKPSTTASAAR